MSHTLPPQPPNSPLPPPPTPPPPTAVPPNATAPDAPKPRSWLASIWSGGQLVLALAITVGVLVYLLSAPASKSESPSDDRNANDEPVRVPAPYLVRIEPNTPLAGKIQTSEIRPSRLSAPVLIVTGT